MNSKSNTTTTNSTNPDSNAIVVVSSSPPLLSNYLLQRTAASDFTVIPHEHQQLSKKEEEGDDDDDDDDDDEKEETCNLKFRTRDSIHALIQRRMKLLHDLNLDIPIPNSDTIATTTTSTSTSTTTSNFQQRIMHNPTIAATSSTDRYRYTNKDITTIMNTVIYYSDEEDKLQIIQNAFSIAAMCVVNAVKEQIELMDTTSHSFDDEGDEEYNEHDGDVKKNIPALLRVLDKIDEIKQESFQLADEHDNIVEKMMMTTTTNTTNTTTTTAAATTTKRKRKSHTTSTNNVQPSSSPSSSSPSLSKRQKKSPTKTNLDRNSNTKNNIINHQNDYNGEEGIKSTTNTSSSTTAAATAAAAAATTTTTTSSTVTKIATLTNTTTDARIIMSRAILCSAASKVFQQHTPDYNCDDDDNIDNIDNNSINNDENHSVGKKKKIYEINSLDIPQNNYHGGIMDDDTEDDTNNNEEEDDDDISDNDLLPKIEKGEEIKSSSTTMAKTTTQPTQKATINMDAVTRAADILATRAMDRTKGAITLSTNRKKWRIDCAKRNLLNQESRLFYNDRHIEKEKDEESSSGIIQKWLTWKICSKGCSEATARIDTNCVTDGSSSSSDDEDYYVSRYASKQQSREWSQKCLPRIIDIMNTGPGHLILHDLQWKSRFSRVAQVLKSLAICNDDKFDTSNHGGHEANYGPHLIITTQADFGHYMGVLGRLEYVVMSDRPFFLRSLGYTGKASKRRRLRKKHFTELGLSGLKDAPFNVIVTTYATFIEDYLHFCNIPFQAVVLDDGMSWLGTASHDPNSLIGKVFDKGIWNQSDNHIGVAGVEFDDWDFKSDLRSKDIIEQRAKKEKQTLIGLTARYRMITAPTMHSMYRGVMHPSPVPGLMTFLFPQFMDVVREEWDRSRLHNCSESVEHMRKLLCRSVVVHTGTNHTDDMHSLALKAMVGKLEIHTNDHTDLESAEFEPSCNDKFQVSTDALIKENKIVQSRRFAASWLRHGSPIRFELGTTSFDPIVNAIKAKTSCGYVCEELVTASSLTSSGAAGVIGGPDAYRFAVRSGRTFSTELALKQHIAAFHAPPGTWICRICAIDCGTSLVRTHHERSCGSNNSSAKDNPFGGALPTVGQVKKKKGSGNTNGSVTEEKDENGCVRVLGYVGIFVDPKGKHFVKIEGKPLRGKGEEETEGNTIFFDTVEDAARRHDDELKKVAGNNQVGLKLNFKADGSRIIYDKTTTTASGRNLEMLGGSASSVVPALSVINIKDLPKGVVPLLRDPKQTPRTGANAKRYVYAYRGVCRQARKGHDRWQSQISFCGTNHYLGTFDSEWDAAAIYAWAHLILYGEEATKKAKEEGEQAVAAYEQEQKDIAAGKIPLPDDSKPKKKKKPALKAKSPTAGRGRKKKDTVKTNVFFPMKLAALDEIKPLYPKMSIGLTGLKMVLDKDDKELIKDVSARLLSSRRRDMHKSSCCCIPISKSTNKLPVGCAVLVGLSATDCNWDKRTFLQSTQHLVAGNEDTLKFALNSEFSDDGLNTRFRAVVKGLPCFIGRASKHLEDAASSLGFYGTELGGTIGNVDCNIGGIDNSCSEIAAILSYSQQEKSFQFSACCNDDSVSVNGNKLDLSKGSVNICNKAILSVGSRVFMLVVPSGS